MDNITVEGVLQFDDTDVNVSAIYVMVKVSVFNSHQDFDFFIELCGFACCKLNVGALGWSHYCWIFEN